MPDAISDVLIVGSGISGTLAATVLGNAGYKVCLIDRHAVYPPDFRAEHLDGPQVDLMRRLGFLEHLTAGLDRGETVTVARFGRVLGTGSTINYGLRYETLVNRARTQLPTNVYTVTGRVAEIQTSDSVQHIQMADGRQIHGRLIVLATGQGNVLGNQVGIRRRTLKEAHSLTFGFDMKLQSGGPFPYPFLIYQRERVRDGVDYFAAFTLGEKTRVNLFTFRGYREPWTKAFLADPDQGLADTLPGLRKVIGPYTATGPIVGRPMDLYVAEDYRRSGIVMIGDAFQASCPATGMGMVRLLTDIEQLCCTHIPTWLATPGMDATKIAAFYDNPVKRACDNKALHDAQYRRAVSTEISLGWSVHRTRVTAMERVQAWRQRSLARAQPSTQHHPSSDASLVAG